MTFLQCSTGFFIPCSRKFAAWELSHFTKMIFEVAFSTLIKENTAAAMTFPCFCALGNYYMRILPPVVMSFMVIVV